MFLRFVDDYSVQAQAWRGGDYHPYHWIQRGNRGVQEH